MKIAILASGNGEKALYLHNFFKEGDRISTEVLLTDNPDSPIAHLLDAEGVEVITLRPGDAADELALHLKGRGVEIIVADGYEGDVPEALKAVYGDYIVYPDSVTQAPMQVIEAVDRLNAPATARKKSPEPGVSPEPGSVEEEWARVLKVRYEPDEDEERQRSNNETEHDEKDSEGMKLEEVEESSAPQPEDSVVIEETKSPPPYQSQPPRQPYQPRQPWGQNTADGGREPMPETYLVWSVIITLLCCLIPGVVAIIFSASVSSKYYAGDIEGARRASRNAQIWCIVSIIAGIVWATLYMPLTLFL